MKLVRNIMPGQFLRLMIFILVPILVSGCGPVLESSMRNTVEPNAIGYYLPKGLIHIELKPAEGSSDSYALTIEPKMVPDYEAFYTVKYDPSSFADDTIDIKVGKNGLLQEVKTTTADKTVDIVKKLMEIVKETAKIPMMIPKGVAKRIKVKEFLNVVFDPDDTNEIKRIHDDLEKVGVEFTVTPLFQKVTYTKLPSYSPSSVYYRLPLPYVISIKSPPAPQQAQGQTPAVTKATGSAKGTTAAAGSSAKRRLPGSGPAKPSAAAPAAEAKKQEEETKKKEAEAEDMGFARTEVIFVPSKNGPELSMDITRAPFVTKATTLTFSDGVLTNAVINKPSEVYAGLDIPLEVIKAIVALPTELIQFRINQTTVQTQAIESAVKEIQAKENLLKALESLKELKKGKTGGASAGPLTGGGS